MLNPVAPEDIEKAEFAVAVRGYSREEVDDFLSSVAQEQRTLLRELETAKRSAEKTYLTLGDEIGSLLQHAKDVADGMVKKAEEGAARVRDEARRAAEKTKKGAEDRAARIIATATGEADECISAAKDRVDALRAAEREAREQLHSLSAMLLSIGNEIQAAESAPPIEREPVDKHSVIAEEDGSGETAKQQPATVEKEPGSEAADLTASR